MTVEKAHIDSEAKEQTCPQCHSVIPAIAGQRIWCDKCGWNLEVPASPLPRGLLEKLYDSLSKKSSQHLFEQMIRGGSLKASLTPAKLVAFLLAGLVHSVTLAFIILGIWLCLFAFPTVRAFGVLLGLACLVAVWLLLIPSSSKVKAFPLPRERYPALYRIADQIAQALGSPPVDTIMYDVHFNASFGQFGWKRKRRLILGLPLFATLQGQEIVALLGHELAHGVNGDPNRGFFLGTALYSLASWYELIAPQRRWDAETGSATLAFSFFNLIALPLVGLIWLAGYALSHLLWYDSQRAEYLADLLGAQVSGTNAQLATLDKSHLRETFETILKFAYIDRKGQNFFQDLRQRINRVSPREIARIRWIEKLTLARIDVTHPPTAHRVEFLRAHPVSEARVTLSSDDLAQLERELEPLLRAVEKRIFELDEMSFREVFRLSW